MKTVYHFFDYWSKTWRSCKVEILSQTEKTCSVKLLEFGPGNAMPGTIIKRVHKSSLDQVKEIHNYTGKQWGMYNYM